MKDQLKIMLMIFWASLILPLFVEDKLTIYCCIAASVISSLYLIVHFSYLIIKQIKESK